MKKIYLVSPREPSGATWLINCFLELGIKTYRKSYAGMWKENKDGNSTLSPHENILKKWLPALTKYKEFKFRKDFEVEWTHEWPTEKFNGSQVIYFIRDPRDSIFSRYKRESPNQSYLEFIEFPDPSTLLNKIDNWCLFNYFWLAFDKISISRFEDYKNNPISTLKSVIQYINLDVNDDLIRNAVEESTFEKASEAEKNYLLDNPDDSEIINRSGKPGEWKLSNENIDISKRIEEKCSELLFRFGYSTINNSNKNTFYLPKLQIFNELITNPLISYNIKYESNAATRILEFSKQFSFKIFIDSRLKVYEATKLIESLIEYLNFYKFREDRNLSKMYISFQGRANYYHLMFKNTKNSLNLLQFAIFRLSEKVYGKFRFMINKFFRTKS